MHFSELKSAIQHLMKTSKCTHCKIKYTEDDIHVVASTTNEGLFDLRCSKCKSSTIVTATLLPDKMRKTPNKSINIHPETQPRIHGGISQNDILDIKNFLTDFDGNFKKLFTRRK